MALALGGADQPSLALAFFSPFSFPLWPAARRYSELETAVDVRFRRWGERRAQSESRRGEAARLWEES